jgi:class 3 adenylate cyclase
LTPSSSPQAAAKAEGSSSPATPPAGWRKGFEQELCELFVRRLRLAALILVLLHSAGFLVFDTSSMSTNSLWVRIGVIPVTGLFFASSYIKPLHRQIRKITILFLLLLVAFVVWNNANLGQPLRTEAMLLLLPAASLLFPFSGRATVLLVALAFVTYTVIAALTRFGVLPGYRQAAFYILCAGVLASIGAFVSFRLREREFIARIEIEQAHEQVEALLLNTLPRPIVERLKAHEVSIADRHDEATVLFSDICGFTTMSTMVSPDALVAFLNELFSEIDALCESHGLEKIKTIGDAYMLAGGLPDKRADHAEAVARMALEMRDLAANKKNPLGEPLRMRIGIHTGPVVAGVIGRRKLNYDLWGDTVNTASRMESHAVPGTIQVTETTYERLRERFELEPRGTVEIKGKGAMATYVLRSER